MSSTYDMNGHYRMLRSSKLLILVALIAHLMSLPGCSGRSAPSDLEAAKADIVRRDFGSAALKLKSYLQLPLADSDAGEARLLLGRSLFELGDVSGAAIEFEKCRQSGYDLEHTLPELARSYVAAGQPKKVIELFSSTSLDTAEGSLDLKASVAAAHEQLGNFKEATAIIADVLAKNPTYPPALIVQAKLLLSEGAPDQALATLDRVTQVDPLDSRANYIKGVILRRFKQDNAAALEAFSRAAKNNSKLFSAHFEICSIYFSQGNLAAAAKHIELVKGIAPDLPGVKYLELQLAYAKNELVKARELSTELLRIAPDYIPYLQAAGAIDLRLKKFITAERMLGKVVAQSPSSIEARILLATTYLEMGNGNACMATLDAVLERSDDKRVFGLAAECSLMVGDFSRAQQHFTKVLTVDKSDIRGRIGLAVSRLAIPNERERAEIELLHLAKEEDGTRAVLSLVSASLQQANYKRALEGIDILASKPGKSEYSKLLRGRVLAAMGNMQGARSEFEEALKVTPTYFPAVEAIVSLDVAAGDRASAQRRLLAYISRNKGSSGALTLLASLAEDSEAGDSERQRLLLEAIKISTSDVQARYMLARHYFLKKSFRDAISVSSDALRLAPLDHRFLEILGLAQAALKEYGQALLTFQKLSDSLPNRAFPLVRVSEVLRAQNQIEQAERIILRAMQLEFRSNTVRKELISVVHASARSEAYQPLLTEHKRIKSDAAYAYQLEGDISAASGHWSKAAEAYKSGLAIDDSNGGLAISLYTALTRSGRTSGADDWIATWLRANSKNFSVLRFLADNEISRRRWKQAELHLRQLVQLRPEDAVTANNLAWALMAMERYNEALPFAERAVRAAPTSDAALDTLALVLSNVGKRERAIEALAAALEADPGRSVLRFRLAKLLAEAGRVDEARSHFKQLAALGDRFSAQGEVARSLSGQ